MKAASLLVLALLLSACAGTPARPPLPLALHPPRGDERLAGRERYQRAVPAPQAQRRNAPGG
ncbi:MAG: hypothetical protein ACK5WM_01160, partial [Rhodospirillales bacterium]